MAETLQGVTQEEIKASVARGEESKWNVGPDGEMLSEGYTMNDFGEVVWVGEGPEPTEEVDNSVDIIPEEDSAIEVVEEEAAVEAASPPDPYKKYLITLLMIKENGIQILLKILKKIIQLKRVKINFITF